MDLENISCFIACYTKCVYTKNKKRLIYNRFIFYDKIRVKIAQLNSQKKNDY